MLIEDLSRDDICSAIAQGIREGFIDAMNDQGLAPSVHRDAINHHIKCGVQDAILDIMAIDNRSRFLSTKDEVLHSIQEGAADGIKNLD